MNAQPTPPEAPAGAPQTLHPPRPAKNTVGRVALALAVAGFVFACIPGALIVGWVLLPAAFILGIVGVTRAGQRKGTSIAAILTSVVGTVVGVVVFLAVAVDAVDQAFEEAAGGDTTAVADDATQEAEPSPEAAAEATVGAAEEATAQAGEDDAAQGADPTGTREHPYAFTDVVGNDRWEIALTGFNPDATAEVADANLFNEEPGAGERWVIVELAATYTGEDSATTMELSIDFVTSDGTVIGSHDALASGLEPEFDWLAEVYAGAVEDGKVALLVPDSVDGLIRVTPGLFADDVFFSLPAA